MDYNFEYEKKKIFNLKKFIKFYSIVFGVLVVTTIITYNLSLQLIFGDRTAISNKEVLGSQTEKIIKNNVNTIVINPNRSKEKDKYRLDLSNGIVGDYLFLFDNENHNFIEGETVPDHNISLSLGNFNVTKKSNPDGFFSFEMPKDLSQFQKGIIELKNDNFQIIKSYSFIFIQKNYFNRKFFLNPNTNIVFSISDIPGYKSSLLNYQGIDNTICSIESQIDSNINNLQKPDENILILPNPLSVENISSKKYAIFEIKNINPAIEIENCIEELKNYDFKIQWYNETIDALIKEGALTPSLPISNPIN